MDLNRLPFQEFNSYLDIRVVSRRKQSLRNVIVRQFGKERFEALLALPTPFIFSSYLMSYNFCHHFSLNKPSSPNDDRVRNTRV